MSLAGETGPGEIAVLDAGKTNLKLCVTDRDGAVIETATTANARAPARPGGITTSTRSAPWVGATLADLARRHPLRVVVPVGTARAGCWWRPTRTRAAPGRRSR
jgi:hypothetical protein